MLRHLPLESETCWFLLFAVLDYFMTYSLMYASEFMSSPIVEANPFAAPLFARYNEYGLLAYKLGWAVVTCCGVQYVALYKPETARVLIWCGVAAGAAVSLYQGVLFLIASGAIHVSPTIESFVTLGV